MKILSRENALNRLKPQQEEDEVYSAWRRKSEERIAALVESKKHPDEDVSRASIFLKHEDQHL